ncbi:MAG: hypothetical protein ACLUI3_04930 [Christensenellales bacterium]
MNFRYDETGMWNDFGSGRRRHTDLSVSSVQRHARWRRFVSSGRAAGGRRRVARFAPRTAGLNTRARSAAWLYTDYGHNPADRSALENAVKHRTSACSPSQQHTIPRQNAVS